MAHDNLDSTQDSLSTMSIQEPANLNLTNSETMQVLVLILEANLGLSLNLYMKRIMTDNLNTTIGNLEGHLVSLNMYPNSSRR